MGHLQNHVKKIKSTTRCFVEISHV
jgi:hypothetical protein